MMRKVILLVVALITGFLIGLVLFFPAKTVVGYLLSKADLGYKSIKGNVFGLYIEDLENKHIKIPNVKVENRFLSVKFTVDDNKASFYPLKKSFTLNLSNLDIQSYYKKKDIKGFIDAKVEGKVKNNYLVLSGDAQIKGLKALFISNLNLKANLKEDGERSKISAKISSPYINGDFEGEVYINITQLKKSRITGEFNGTSFGRKVNQKIDKTLEELQWQ